MNRMNDDGIGIQEIVIIIVGIYMLMAVLKYLFHMPIPFVP